MTKGNIILLNGTSSSGKSTLARALLLVLDECALIIKTAIDRTHPRVAFKQLVQALG